jgi:polyisoprenoid-binding protein YceI
LTTPHRPRTPNTTLAVVVLLATLATALWANAAPSQRGAKAKATRRSLVVAQPSTLGFDGDSTLHRYQVRATQFSVSGDVPALADEITATTITAALCRGDATLTIPVKGLKSSKDGLDERLYEALRADRFPLIVFRFASCRATRRADGSYAAVLEGRLTVTNRTEAITLEAIATPGKEGVRLVGRKTLRMTQFGIQPPTLFFGKLKTDDEVKVFFDLQLRAR